MFGQPVAAEIQSQKRILWISRKFLESDWGGELLFDGFDSLKTFSSTLHY